MPLPIALGLLPSAYLVVAFLLGVVLGEVDAPFTEDFRDGPLAALDAIRDANAPVAAAGEGETGNLGTAVFDPCNPLEVSQGVLGHAEVPPEDAREERLRKGVETQDVMKLGEDCLDEFFIGALHESPGCADLRQSRAAAPSPEVRGPATWWRST